MSFASTNRIPYFRTYEQAKKWHDMTKPIRGVTPELRPLAARRDKHMHIRENAQGDIECVLYQTPVVIFKKTGTITISPGKWPSAFTCSFISNVLPRVSARTTRGNLVVKVGGTEYPLKKDMTIEVAYEAHKHDWSVAQATGVPEWRPNRAKANSVRAKYSEFLKYYKGFMGMLTEQADNDDNPNDRDPFEAKSYVRLQMDMVKQVFGTKTVTESHWNGSGGPQRVEVEALDVNEWRSIRYKPVWSDHDQQATKDWRDQSIKMQCLMHNDQPAETKYENFLKAAVILFGLETFGSQYNFRIRSESISLSKSKALELANDFILRMYAEEIMEQVTLPVGKVPSGKYGSYLFNSFRKEQGENV